MSEIPQFRVEHGIPVVRVEGHRESKPPVESVDPELAVPQNRVEQTDLPYEQRRARGEAAVPVEGRPQNRGEATQEPVVEHAPDYRRAWS